MEWVELLDRYGLPIAMLLTVAIGRFVPGFIYAERKKELEEAISEIKRLNDFVITEVTPALARQADAVETAIRILSAIEDERKIRVAAEELEKRHQHREPN